MNKLLFKKIAVIPFVKSELKSANKTMPLAMAVWAKVFILFLLLGFWRTGEAQSLFAPGNPPIAGDAPVGVNLPPLTFPTSDLHVDGTVRFQNLPNSIGMNRYLTTDPLGNLFWQNGIAPQLGFAFGQTLYWDGAEYVPTNFLHVDPFSGGSGAVGIGTSTPSAKLNLHVSNPADHNFLSFSKPAGMIQADAYIGQRGGLNEFIIQQSHFSNMVFNINTHDHMVLNPLGDLGIGDRGASIGITERLHLHEEDVMDPLYMLFTRGMNPSPPGARIGVDGGGTSPDHHALRIIQDVGSSYIGFYTSGNERMRVDNTGIVRIGTAFSALTRGTNVTTGAPGPGTTSTGVLFAVNGAAEFNGEVYSASDFWLSSDERLKTNFSNLNSDWKKILTISPYSYDFKKVDGLNLSTRRSFGFKAQEVKEVFPSLVSEGDSFLAVNYIGFIPFLTQGIQEHEEKLNTIEQEREVSNVEIEELKVENKELKERLAALEEFVYKQQGNGEGFGQSGTLNKPATLAQNEPNPFTQETVIHYFLPEGSVNAKIEIKNVEGKVVGTFLLSQAGQGSMTLSAGTLSAGSYFYSLIVNNRIIDTKKMILLN